VKTSVHLNSVTLRFVSTVVLVPGNDNRGSIKSVPLTASLW
jgi:hypothetical protein